ncbi:MAG: phosphopantothenoylcysteine decarboxylase, partial [Acidilobaceae archaeon]
EAWARGAEVDIVMGVSSVKLPQFLNVVTVETTREMAETVARLTDTKTYDAVVSVAAPLDFEIETKNATEKLPSNSEIQIKLKPAVKVLNSIRRKPGLLVVFTATPREDIEGLAEAGLEKLNKYNADIVIANTAMRAGKGFGAEELNALLVLRENTTRYLGYIHKEILARHVVDEIVKVFKRSQR